MRGAAGVVAAAQTVALRERRRCANPISRTVPDSVTMTFSGREPTVGQPVAVGDGDRRGDLAHQPGGAVGRQHLVGDHRVERLPGAPLVDHPGEPVVGRRRRGPAAGAGR